MKTSYNYSYSEETISHSQLRHHRQKCSSTLDSSVNIWQWGSLSSPLAVLMISLHFFGVSSTLPAKNKQQAAVTWEKGKRKHASCSMKDTWKLSHPGLVSSTPCKMTPLTESIWSLQLKVYTWLWYIHSYIKNAGHKSQAAIHPTRLIHCILQVCLHLNVCVPHCTRIYCDANTYMVLTYLWNSWKEWNM